MTLARLMVVLGLDSNPFKVGMTAAMTQIGVFQRSLGALTAGQSLSSVGRGLTMALTIPILAAGAAVGILGNNLAAEMARVQSVIATPGDLRSGLISGWTDDVQRLGVTLGRTSPEVAGGLYEIVSAFGALENTVDFLTIAGRAAVAGQSDIVTSTRNLALMTHAWGDASTDQVRIMADLGSATVRVGTLTESEMGGAMAGLLPIMKLYNVGLNEGFAGLASLAGVSGTASQASTQLQRAITSIVAPNTALTKQYKALGIESGEALLAQKGLLGAFDTIRQISEATGVPLQKLMGRIEGVKAVATLTGPQLTKFNENLTAMERSAGDVDRAFAGATEGVNRAGFQWAQAGQRLRTIAEDLYLAFAPAALNVGDSLAPIGRGLQVVADAVGRMDTGTLTNVLYGLLGLAALGPVLTVIGSLSTLFGGLTTVLAAANPWVLAVAAAGGLLWAAWNNDWGGIQGGVFALMDTISQRADATRQAIENLQEVWDKFRNPQATGGTDGPVKTLRDVGTAVGDVWKALGPAQGELSRFEKSMIESPRKVQGAWDVFWSGFTSNWPDFSQLGADISAVFSGIGQSIGQAMSGIGTAIQGGWMLTVSSTAASLGLFVGAVKTGFGNAIAAAKTGVGNIKSAFTGAGWASVGSSIASGIASGITSGIGWIKSAAVGAATAALSAAKSALGIKSPSSVFRNQVGAMIPLGMALGIHDGASRVERAIGSLLVGGSYGLPGIEGRATLAGVAMAGAGGGSTTHETSYGDIIVNVMVGNEATGNEIGVSISKALRNRGLI